TIFDVPSRSEETFWLVEGIGIHTPTEYLPRGRLDRVVGPCQSGDGIQEDHHIMATFDQSFGLVQYNIGYPDVFCGLFVKGGGDHFPTYVALHIGDLLRSFVD